MSDENDEIKFVVGIDFGKTYTGYAFSLSCDELIVYSPQVWNSAHGGMTSLRTPTSLLLNPDQTLCSQTGLIMSKKCATQNVMPESPGDIVHRVQIDIYIVFLFYLEENAEKQGIDKYCKFHDTEDREACVRILPLRK